MTQKTRHRLLQELDALVGDWEINATIDGETMASGRTSFRWMEGAPFLIQRTGDGSGVRHDDNGWVENAPDGMTMVIGPDDTHELYAETCTNGQYAASMTDANIRTEHAFRKPGNSSEKDYDATPGTTESRSARIVAALERNRHDETGTLLQFQRGLSASLRVLPGSPGR